MAGPAAAACAYVCMDTEISFPEALSSFTSSPQFFFFFWVPRGTGNRSGCKSDAPWPDSNPSGQVVPCQSSEKQWHRRLHFLLLILALKMLLASPLPGGAGGRCLTVLWTPHKRHQIHGQGVISSLSMAIWKGALRLLYSQLAEALPRDFWAHTVPFLKS